jgi:hypothetical protein
LYLEVRDPTTIKFPVGGVMIFGYNFDSEFGFKESARRGKEKPTSGMWGPLLRLLKEADGDDSLVYQGWDHREFQIACRTVLNAKIEIQPPRLIITLGLHVPPLLAALSSNLSLGIGQRITLKDRTPCRSFVQPGFGLAME